jgi:hypothetical protein
MARAGFIERAVDPDDYSADLDGFRSSIGENFRAALAVHGICFADGRSYRHWLCRLRQTNCRSDFTLRTAPLSLVGGCSV